MATHWIPAQKALQLIADNSCQSTARLALCTRAYDELIRTRARLLITGKDREDNVSIPASFWRGKGHEKTDQDWAIGDFSNSIDQPVNWQAFGVMFDLDGIREMLSPESSAIIARDLSVAGNNQWITTNAARIFISNNFGQSENSAGISLIDQCRLGFVAARAVEMRQNVDQYVTADAREWDIPVWFWEEFTRDEITAQNWERGQFSGFGSAPLGRCNMKLKGVHFARSSMEAMLPAKPFETRPALGVVAGGRPTAGFWDDLWCSICADINNGDLKPDRQNTIEKAMLEWAAAHDHELSQSSARSRARKLFAALKREDKNP